MNVFGEKLIKDLEANTEKLNEDTQKNSILVLPTLSGLNTSSELNAHVLIKISAAELDYNLELSSDIKLFFNGQETL